MVEFLERLVGRRPQATADESSARDLQAASHQPRHDPAVVDIFLEQARSLAEWHFQRAEGFERKAGILLTAEGVILTLMLQVFFDPLQDVSGWPQWPLLAGVIIAVLLLATAILFALLSIAPRRTRFPERSQVSDEWASYRNGPEKRQSYVAVQGIFVGQLLGKQDCATTLDALAEDADARGEWMRKSLKALVAGLGVVAALTIGLFTQGVVDDGSTAGQEQESVGSGAATSEYST